MEKMERWAIVARLVQEMRTNKGWAGETHIHKTLFFLQELLKVPVGYDFTLYRHGPYGFDLHDDLGGMLANAVLALERTPPYGPRFLVEDVGDRVIQHSDEVVKKYNSQVQFIAVTLSDKDVRDLERLGTALLLKDQFPDFDQETLAGKVVEVKPHVSGSLALEAVREVFEIEAAARKQCLIAPL